MVNLHQRVLRAGRRLAVAVALLAASSQATAGDFYVDAVQGDNMNSGTSPQFAWKTITHAMTTVGDPGTGFHTIHVAPGVYGAALGESFPLVLEEGWHIVGDQGSEVTILDGGSFLNDASHYPTSFAGALLQGLTIRNGGYALYVSHDDGEDYYVRLVDVSIEDMLGAVWADWYGTGDGVTVLLEGSSIVDCDFGVRVRDYGAYNLVGLSLVDTRVEGCTGIGIEFRCGPSSLDDLVVERCRIEGNGVAGLRIEPASGGHASSRIEDTAFVANAGHGLLGLGADVPGGLGTTIERCTFADNTGTGIFVSGCCSWVPVLTSCIVTGNGDDIDDLGGALQATYTNIGDGDLAGSTGNISADPLFVDAPSGDYGLQAGSPCVDTGDPGLDPDPDGTRADMGAHFFDQGDPVAYCTGKTSSQGCVPFLERAGTGRASVSDTGTFVVRGSDFTPGNGGVLVYGFKKSALGFHGGKLCVKTPVRTAGKAAKTVASVACGAATSTGRLATDFNNRIQGGFDPLLTSGQTVFVQWHQRDPTNTLGGFADSLSNGLRFTIGP